MTDDTPTPTADVSERARLRALLEAALASYQEQQHPSRTQGEKDTAEHAFVAGWYARAKDLT